MKALVDQFMTLLQKNGPAFWQGIFDLERYSYFGLCTCGRIPKRLNVGAEHFMTCKKCRTYWPIGENLFSDWKLENKSHWRRAKAFLQSATRIEPVQPLLIPNLFGTLATLDQIHGALARLEDRCAAEDILKPKGTRGVSA